MLVGRTILYIIIMASVRNVSEVGSNATFPYHVHVCNIRQPSCILATLVYGHCMGAMARQAIDAAYVIVINPGYPPSGSSKS
jgi:hypothetical protein